MANFFSTKQISCCSSTQRGLALNLIVLVYEMWYSFAMACNAAISAVLSPRATKFAMVWEFSFTWQKASTFHCVGSSGKRSSNLARALMISTSLKCFASVGKCLPQLCSTQPSIALVMMITVPKVFANSSNFKASLSNAKRSWLFGGFPLCKAEVHKSVSSQSKMIRVQCCLGLSSLGL